MLKIRSAAVNACSWPGPAARQPDGSILARVDGSPDHCRRSMCASCGTVHALLGSVGDRDRRRAAPRQAKVEWQLRELSPRSPRQRPVRRSGSTSGVRASTNQRLLHAPTESTDQNPTSSACRPLPSAMSRSAPRADPGGVALDDGQVALRGIPMDGSHPAKGAPGGLQPLASSRIGALVDVDGDLCHLDPLQASPVVRLCAPRCGAGPRTFRACIMRHRMQQPDGHTDESR